MDRGSVVLRFGSGMSHETLLHSGETFWKVVCKSTIGLLHSLVGYYRGVKGLSAIRGSLVGRQLAVEE